MTALLAGLHIYHRICGLLKKIFHIMKIMRFFFLSDFIAIYIYIYAVLPTDTIQCLNQASDDSVFVRCPSFKSKHHGSLHKQTKKPSSFEINLPDFT